jgi:hypothetical protein
MRPKRAPFAIPVRAGSLLSLVKARRFPSSRVRPSRCELSTATVVAGKLKAVSSCRFAAIT